MHTRRIDGVNRLHPRQHRRDHRPGEFVDQPAELRILLRRPPHHRERPNRIAATGDGLDFQYRKRMRQAVVSQMIAERPLGQQSLRIDRAANAKIRIGQQRQADAVRVANQPRPPTAQEACEAQLAHPLGQRHDRRHAERRRPAHGDVDAKRLACPNRRRVMHADRAVNLVVQPDLAVRGVLVPRQLHAVHPQVAPPQARFADVFRIDDW